MIFLYQISNEFKLNPIFLTGVNLQMRSSFSSGSSLVRFVAKDPRLILVSEDRVANNRLKTFRVFRVDQESWRISQDFYLVQDIGGSA